MGKLENKVAVVTGAARGIGAATATKLAAEGARVVIADVDVALCEQLVARLGAERAIAVGCDVTQVDQVNAMVELAVSTFGQVDILVNNAGIIRDNLLFKMTDDDFDKVMAVHVKGAFLCARATQKHMVERKYGRIISLSSTSALGNRGQTNYSAAKAALQGMTRTLALELGQFGITANAVAPGFIDTDMTKATAQRMGLTPEQFQTAASQFIALRRVGKPEEVANVIAFLASDEASYVSGQVIYVAGGPAGQ